MLEDSERTVAYIVNENLLKCLDTIPIINGRATLVHELLLAYGLTNKMEIVPPRKASEEQIRTFHSEEYVNMLKEENFNEDEQDDYGLGYDCPILENMWHIVLSIAGSSITAAEVLVEGKAQIAINWCGGWHHAQRDSASGFCYVNDIVLAIQTLKSKFDKVLYIDLDIHHGDGLENAYLFTKKIFTLSFHQWEPGFFPGTGEVSSIGRGQGTSFNANVPYNNGIDDAQFIYIFEKVFCEVKKVFSPDAIVFQCGADALAQDPLGGANLTEQGYSKCLEYVLELEKPVLILGGGGYKMENAAKLWTNLTACCLKETLDDDIPEHRFFTRYGPDFTLTIHKSLKKSSNTKQALDKVLQCVSDNLARVVL